MKELPNILSDLIELAYNDLNRLVKEGFIPDMLCWVQYNASNDECKVCLAGAVLIGTLNRDYRQNPGPGSMDVPTHRKLYAIDDFRMGSWSTALRTLGEPPPSPILRDQLDNLHRWDHIMWIPEAIKVLREHRL